MKKPGRAGDPPSEVRTSQPERVQPLSGQEVMDLADRLQDLGKARRRLLAANSERAGSPQVVRELNSRALASIEVSPSAALEAAEAAVEVAEAMPPVPGCLGLSSDLRAEALAFLANAWRLKEDFTAAREVWHQCSQALARGTGDPVLAADLGEAKSAFLVTRRQLREAEALVASAVAVHRRTGDRQRLGRALFRLARVRSRQGDLGASLALANEALSLLPEAEQPHMVLMVLLNIGYTLDLMGESERAFLLLTSAGPRFRKEASSLTQGKFHWELGRLSYELGRPAVARGMLEAARRHLLDRQMYFDAALCGLDLAIVYTALGQPDARRRLAEETLPVCSRLGFEQEALPVLRPELWSPRPAAPARTLPRLPFG